MQDAALIILKSVILFFATILIVRLMGRRWLSNRTGWDRIVGLVIAFIVAGMSVNLISIRPGILALAAAGSWSWLLLII